MSDVQIHPTAIVDPRAEIGAGTTIGPYCVIAADVVLGQNCWLQQHVTLCGPMRAGAGNKFYASCSIGQQTQDLKYQGEPTYLEIGDENTFREFVTISRSTTSQGKTRIGNRGTFLAYSHIAHDCMVGDDVVFSNNGTLAGYVEVGDHAVIGGLTAVHQFCRIGRFAITGGCSKIVQDVPPFMIADGNPAEIRGINLIGLERKNFPPESVKLIKEVFRLIYRSKYNTQQAIEAIRRELPQTEEITQILQFIEKKRARNYSLSGLPRWRGLAGSALRIFLKFPQQRRCRRVGSSLQRTSDKIDSSLRLVLLDPCVRFLEHHTQNVIAVRIKGSRWPKTICCCRKIPVARFHQTEVFDHWAVACLRCHLSSQRPEFRRRT